MIKIYDYTYFELRSNIRNLNFRFARYTGKNYENLKSYINEISEATKVWDEKLLKKGYYYSFLSSNRSFTEIPEYELRACIASNPYLVDGDNILPIFISRQEAVEYLKNSSNNRVFPYDLISDSYAFDSHKGKFVVYNSSHHRGLSIDELPMFSEWYIGKEDFLYLVSEHVAPVYHHDTHHMHLDFGIRDKADKALDLIYEINKLSITSSDRKCIFNPAWEDTYRYRTLYRICLNEAKFKDFISVLYNYIFEETKCSNATGKQIAKGLLPNDFKSDEFVIHVGEFRNFYFHGQSEYNSPNISGPELFNKYINVSMPRQDGDYETLQVMLLNAFIDFLTRLKEYVQKNSPVEGIICCDDDNNIYCGDVLLPKTLRCWVGHQCHMRNRMNNNIYPLSNKFPFFCQIPLIDVDVKGILSVDLNEDAIYEYYNLGKGLQCFVGWSICIKKIMPYVNSGRDSEVYQLNWYVKSVEIVKPAFYELSKKLVNNIINNLMDEEICDFSEKEIWNAGSYFLERVEGRWKMTSIKSSNNYDYGRIEEDSRLIDTRGKIEKDEQGSYHVKNVLIPAQFGRYNEGKECVVRSYEKCKSKQGKNLYEYFSKDIRILKKSQLDNVDSYEKK